jgi:hypothetical protein
MSPAFRASGNYFAVAEKVLHETYWFISEIAKSSFTAEGAETAEARPGAANTFLGGTGLRARRQIGWGRRPCLPTGTEAVPLSHPGVIGILAVRPASLR